MVMNKAFSERVWGSRIWSLQFTLTGIVMVVTGCSIIHPHGLDGKIFFDTHVIDWCLGLLMDAADYRAQFPQWLKWNSMHPLWLWSHWLCASSLYCRHFGLEADECSVCPIAEELEVLKKLLAGLEDVKLIGEVRGEGGGCWSLHWCFHSQHLWRTSKQMFF